LPSIDRHNERQRPYRILVLSVLLVAVDMRSPFFLF
jgi:hypothetical protein